jgi:hypothetical protein
MKLMIPCPWTEFLYLAVEMENDLNFAYKLENRMYSTFCYLECLGNKTLKEWG